MPFVTTELILTEAVDHCIGLSRYIAITTFSNIAAIAAFCRISPRQFLIDLNQNLQAQ